ncbi:cytochrome P450 [Sporosarcina sp. 179-K 3D1 HS]|uniref:cytochrome P450 n=1 Tax=Sporosarcina sp. 179-K 3D1 HS TaxID=3232169 RepID=UPI0039A0EA43
MLRPKESGWDHSLDLLAEGYSFIRSRAETFDAPLFETRIMGKKMICMTGKEAVQLFYDDNRFQRHGAVPKRIQKSLFGVGGVQTLDGELHLIRKKLFLSLMTEEKLAELHRLTLAQWRLWAMKRAGREVVLFDETEEILCRVACLWAGVPLKESDLAVRAYELGAMVDAFGGVGPRYQEGVKARKRAEQWIVSLIEKCRAGAVEIEDGRAIHAVVTHRDADSQMLDIRIAAVELINVLRPIVAVARFVIFGALALHDFPEYKEKLKEYGEDYLEMFSHEVRRYYPFAPMLGAKVRYDFKWKGYHFAKGETVLLDLYGTNHDPELWENPNIFRPERFEERKEDLYEFVPQGGGDPNTGHRCPGEKATVEIMKASFRFLVEDLDYEVVDGQDLTVSFVRMPTLPKSRFVIRMKS